MKFTEIDKAILIGLLLGDGYINDKGRIEIEYYSREDLERIIDLITHVSQE